MALRDLCRFTWSMQEKAVMPVETRYPTWRKLGWDEDRATLLELRAKQLEMRDEDLQESKLRKDRRRIEGKEYFDATHQIRTAPIKEKGPCARQVDGSRQIQEHQAAIPLVRAVQGEDCRPARPGQRQLCA